MKAVEDAVTIPNLGDVVEEKRILAVAEAVDEIQFVDVRPTPELSQDDVWEHEEVKLPSNKADYRRMSVAEKFSCYSFDKQGTEAEFGLVKAYFETVGMDRDFHTVYEEARLLTDYYEKQKTEEFIQERTEQIIETMELLGINVEKIAEYPTSVLAEVFGFDEMEYFAGIKLFNQG